MSFFISIGLIITESTLIPISPVEKSFTVFDVVDSIDDEWEDVTLDQQNDSKVELKYSLSNNGVRYVIDNLWSLFSPMQLANLSAFKKNINSISLDSLLNYVYNKYPEDAINSKIASKYLEKE